jgi:PAS domain S-box-containing protein
MQKANVQDEWVEVAHRRRLEAVLVSTLQNLTQGVLAVGGDGVIILANPAACRLLERPLEELAGARIEKVLASMAGAEDLLAALREGGEGRRREWTRRIGEGPTRRLELTAEPAQPPWDVHLAGLVLVEDVTELRRLEQQAALKSRLTGMGEIAIRLAHEIRNPLGSIALFATALESELREDGELASLASQIAAGVRSLEHLVANTLEFSRPRRMAVTRVHLGRLIEETLVYVEHPLGQKSIQVDFDAETAADAQIAGDAEQLRQVILNLVINAIQAMDLGGRLRIGIERGSEGGWLMTVGDDGPGIAREILGRIFDPFFTTREKGSGIGLAVAHSIVAAHGGRIGAESAPGEGATFRVWLPEEMVIE